MTDDASFEFTISGDCATITFHTDVTETIVQQVRRKIQEHADSGIRNFIIDLSRLKMIASITVGLLVGVRAKTVETGGRVAVVNTSPTIQKMFEMIRITAIIPIVASMEDALKAISANS